MARSRSRTGMSTHTKRWLMTLFLQVGGNLRGAPTSLLNREGDIDHRLLSPAQLRVETARRDVRFLGAEPRLAAADCPTVREQDLEEPSADAARPVRWRHADLV